MWSRNKCDVLDDIQVNSKRVFCVDNTLASIVKRCVHVDPELVDCLVGEQAILGDRLAICALQSAFGMKDT